MLAWLGILVLGQTRIVEPPRDPPAGCAAMTAELDRRIHLDDGGFAVARESCYEQLALGMSRDEVGRAMQEYAAAVAAAPAPDPGGPVPGDGWIALLPAPPIAPVVASRPATRAPLPSIEMHYWGSCDGRGPHGACDQMGVAAFRLAPELWAQMRYFDFYADGDTAGAAGLGFSEETENLAVGTGLWIGSWARDCAVESCHAGGAFVLPWASVRLGPPLIYVDAGLADGPYVSSGHARIELGHRFLDGSRVEVGVTAGVFGSGAAMRADARLMMIGHLSLDLYGSSDSDTFALGAGAGFRY